MDDLISRQAAIELCDWYEHEFSECDYAIRALADDLKSLPTAGTSVVTMKLNADPEEVKKLIKRSMTLMPTAEERSRWTERRGSEWAGGGAWVCSECGFGYAFGAYHEADEFNYCPNCGARMEESE